MSQKMKYSTYILLVRKELNKSDCSYICICNTETATKLYKQGKDCHQYANKLKAYICSLLDKEHKIRKAFYGMNSIEYPNTLNQYLEARYGNIDRTKARKQLLLDYANYMKARKQ